MIVGISNALEVLGWKPAIELRQGLSGRSRYFEQVLAAESAAAAGN